MERAVSTLVIPGHVVYPANSGGAHNQLSFLVASQKLLKLSLILTPENCTAADLPALKKLLPDVQFIELGFKPENKWQKARNFLRKQRRKWSGVDAGYALWKNRFINNFLIKDAGLVWQIAEVVKDLNFDIIQIDHTKNLALVPLMPAQSKVVFVHHELYFTRVQQEMERLQYPAPYVAYITNLVKAIEIYFLNGAKGVVTFNEDDMALLAKEGVTVPMQVSKPYCLLQKETNIYEAAVQPKLVFIGGEGHYPNKDGLVWYLEEVHPLLPPALQQVPIAITGEWSEEFKRKYAALPLQFVGFVPDLNAVLKDAILLAPIRIGSGVRIKICTSIAKGLPVVSTALGASGITGLVHEESIMLAETAKDFARAVKELLENEALRKKLSDNVFELAGALFSGEAFVATRLHFFESILLSPSKTFESPLGAK